MRIIVNNVAASSGGALTILKSFYNYVNTSEICQGIDWVFLVGDDQIKSTKNVRVITLKDVKKSWFNRLKFDLYSGKDYISKLNPDLVVSFQNTIVFGMAVPQVVYVHQSIPFQTVKSFSFIKKDERTLAVYQHLIGKLIKQSIKKSTIVVVQTQWMKDSIIRLLNLPDKKISVIFPPLIEMKVNDEKNLIVFNKNEFFYPATNLYYKNHDCIYKACAILRNNGYNNFNVSLTIEGEKIEDNITNLGKLKFEEVINKYTSTTLIFPSYIETIGLPLLEAKAYGNIILVADCAYSREVLNGYANAYYFDPFKPEQLAELMMNVINGKINYRDLNDSSLELKGDWQPFVKVLKETTGG